MIMLRVVILMSAMVLCSSVSAMDVEFTLADGKVVISSNDCGKLSRFGGRNWRHNHPNVSSETFKEIIAGLDTLEKDPGAFLRDEYKKRSVAEYEALMKASIEMEMLRLINAAFIKVTSEEGYALVAKDIVNCAFVRVYEQDKNGDTPLIRASKAGLTDVVECILEADYSGVDKRDAQRRTALHWAAEMGHKKIVSLLLKHHATVDEDDSQNKTALHLAASKGFVKIAKLLLSHGAKGSRCWMRRSTPLHEAAIAGHTEMVKLLLNAPNADINEKGNDGRTALAEACIHGRITVVKALFELHATHKLWVENTSKHSTYSAGGEYTAFEWAVLRGHTDIVKEFVKFYKAEGVSSSFPLYLAAEMGNAELVALFLEAGADSNNGGNGKYSPLISASRKGHLNVVKQLVKVTPEIDKMGYRDNLTALIHASKKGRVDVVRVLLRAGANVHHQDRDGNTALIFASFKGHVEVAQLLLRWGASVDHQNDHGVTALMAATEYGHKEVIALLLSWYARTDIADKQGDTVLTLAKKGTKKDIEELLLKGPSKRWVTFAKKAVVAGLVTFAGYKAYEKYSKNYKVQDGSAVEAGPFAA